VRVARTPACPPLIGASLPSADMSADQSKWEYATVPLLTHATKQILDQWGEDGWELVTVLPGPTGEQLVAYLKRPRA
jgi:hypothetical protein